MAHAWQGLLTEFEPRLNAENPCPVVSLGEGGTPLIHLAQLSEKLSCQVYCKYEGMNPTGSFKDRGMTVAISRAVGRGATAVLCASTGNTSASAAAYAAAAGIDCIVLLPQGNIAPGKLGQAAVHGARMISIAGNFDDCLRIAQELTESEPITLVNSVNPDRIDGQQSAAWEIVDALGDAPDVHCLPVGNAGNISAYWAGYVSDHEMGRSTKKPQMWGVQAAGAAPFVAGAPMTNPETIATAIRIGAPASWDAAQAALTTSDGAIWSVTDEEILAGQRYLAETAGIFVEPASAAPIAGLLQRHAAGTIDPGLQIVVTVTGHGLKDVQWATQDLTGPNLSIDEVPATTAAVLQTIRKTSL